MLISPSLIHVKHHFRIGELSMYSCVQRVFYLFLIFLQGITVIVAPVPLDSVTQIFTQMYFPPVGSFNLCRSQSTFSTRVPFLFTLAPPQNTSWQVFTAGRNSGDVFFERFKKVKQICKYRRRLCLLFPAQFHMLEEATLLRVDPSASFCRVSKYRHMLIITKEVTETCSGNKSD